MDLLQSLNRSFVLVLGIITSNQHDADKVNMHRTEIRNFILGRQRFEFEVVGWIFFWCLRTPRSVNRVRRLPTCNKSQELKHVGPFAREETRICFFYVGTIRVLLFENLLPRPMYPRSIPRMNPHLIPPFALIEVPSFRHKD